MKTTTFLIGTVLAMVPPLVHAGQVPDILWRTNANQRYTFKVLFAPDSASVFTYGGDAKLWRISDRSLLRTFVIPRQDIAAIALSPDGTRLVGRGREIGFRMWRVSDGAVLYASDPSGGLSLAFSPAGNFVARGDGEGSIFLRGIDGESVTGITVYYDVHRSGVAAVTFSPDGTLLLSGGNDSTAKLLRVSDGVVVQTFDHLWAVHSVAFSPDGRTLATAVGDGYVRLWSTNGTLLQALPVAGSPFRALDFSPDGKLLATAAGRLIQFWRVADGAHLVTYGPDPVGPNTTVDISPDGKLFAYGGGELVVARMPVVVTKAEQRRNEFNFHWQGGSGVYQVQTTSNVVQGPWVNLGPPTTNTSLTVTVDSAAPGRFFRIQSLPAGP